jgi:ribosomal protein S18 acetylase RimI-like enzyme
MHGIGDEPPGVMARVATQTDLPRVTEILRAAFRNDPLWSWVFPDPDKLAVWWRFLIGSALRYPWVFVADDHVAASVWIPAGGSELTPSEEDEVEPLLEELLGARAAMALELLERFDAAHPGERPHYYLSLLGVQPDRRGAGFGMGLLAENLARIDAEGVPAYLESSNPANLRRYERLGFQRIGEFSTPDDSHTVTTMWREAP